jgi:hypothetical protein
LRCAIIPLRELCKIFSQRAIVRARRKESEMDYSSEDSSAETLNEKRCWLVKKERTLLDERSFFSLSFQVAIL